MGDATVSAAMALLISAYLDHRSVLADHALALARDRSDATDVAWAAAQAELDAAQAELRLARQGFEL